MMPVIKGINGLSKARQATRARMSRYVDLLSLFSDFKGDSLNWTSFEFKDEYNELKAAGLITGQIANVVDPDTKLGTGEQVLCRIGVTVEGVGKMAELSEFLWKTSIVGKVTASIVQMLWLVAGVIIGHLLSDK
jgi:hypothetical protein